MCIRKIRKIKYLLFFPVIPMLYWNFTFNIQGHRYLIKRNENSRQFSPLQNDQDASNNHSIHSFEQNFCQHKYGDIAIVQFMFSESYMENYVFNALQSLRCYARLRNYTLYQINYDGKHENVSVSGNTSLRDIYVKCNDYVGILKKRHCVVSNLLPYYDYIIHIDADSGIVNPRHCFEEYINPKVSLSFLIRAHSGEIQAGHYIAKNTEYAQSFLLQWASMSGDNDQPALHTLISKTFLNETSYKKCEEEPKKKGYFKWISCIRQSMFQQSQKQQQHQQQNHINSNHDVMMFSRAQSFVRDGWTTQFKWAETDFMFHAMKGPDDVLFTRKLQRSDCPANSTTWNIPLVDSYYVNSFDKMKEIWMKVEKNHHVKYKSFALIEDISTCWPYCSNLIL